MAVNTQTIKQATIGIAVLVLLSKAIGFLREVIIAYRFGTSIEYDIYLIAVSIPIALYSLFGYAFSNLFIPTYSYAVSSDNKRPGLRALWSDFNLSLVAAGLAMVAIIVLAPSLIRLIAPGLAAVHIPDAVLIVRVSSIIVILAVLEAFFRSILNAEKNFLIPAAGPILANIVLIASILMFAGRISTKAILYGLVIGYMAQVVLVFIPFRKSAIIEYIHARLLHRLSGKFFATAVVILIIEASSQIYAFVDRYFASSMAPGVVSALGYSYLLIMLPVSIFAYALTTAIFPYMTDAFAQQDKSRIAHLLSRGITVSLLLALPAAMICWVFADKLVILLFKRGAFDMQSVAYTSNLLQYFALGLAGQFIIWIMSRAYYAAQKYKILIALVVVVVASKIVLAVLFVSTHGYIGLAVSSAISYSVGAMLLLAFTGVVLVRVDAKGILLYVGKAIVATAGGFAMAWTAYNFVMADWVDFVDLLIGVPAAIVASLAVFAAIGYIVNIPDIRHLVSALRGR